MLYYVLPVSGGAFPTQLAAIQCLCDAGFHPDVTLAASGGNVAAYVAAAGEWKSNGIERVASTLQHSYFFRPWIPVGPFNALFSFFKGSVYRQVDVIPRLLHLYFTPSTIVKDEIWSGTYNRTKHRAQFFCNRDEKDSIIHQLPANNESLSNCLPLTYLNGDIDVIANICMATASIPALISPCQVRGEMHCDGGVYFASPLSCMHEIIGKENHLIYINSFDLNERNDLNQNLIDNGMFIFSRLVQSKIMDDRLIAFRTLEGPVQACSFPCTANNLKVVKEIQKVTKQSLLEIYPKEYKEVNITNFVGDDVIEAMEEVRPVLKCRFWWSGRLDLSHLGGIQGLCFHEPGARCLADETLSM